MCLEGLFGTLKMAKGCQRRIMACDFETVLSMFQEDTPPRMFHDYSDVVILGFSLFLVHAANKESLVVDYNVLGKEQAVIAFFLPEAPSEMFKIFDEVSSTRSVCRIQRGGR